MWTHPYTTDFKTQSVYSAYYVVSSIPIDHLNVEVQSLNLGLILPPVENATGDFIS